MAHDLSHSHLSRRGFIRNAGLAATAGLAAGTVGVAGTAAAHPQDDDHGLTRIPVKGMPKPIVAGVDAPPVGFIHWLLPGPEGSMTPILQIPGFGLDVDPSLITDFKGVQAYAVVSGEVDSTDGKQTIEFDVRAMKGTYVDVNGDRQQGAFAFL